MANSYLWGGWPGASYLQLPNEDEEAFLSLVRCSEVHHLGGMWSYFVSRSESEAGGATQKRVRSKHAFHKSNTDRKTKWSRISFRNVDSGAYWAPFPLHSINKSLCIVACVCADMYVHECGFVCVYPRRPVWDNLFSCVAFSVHMALQTVAVQRFAAHLTGQNLPAHFHLISQLEKCVWLCRLGCWACNQKVPGLAGHFTFGPLTSSYSRGHVTLPSQE